MTKAQTSKLFFKLLLSKVIIKNLCEIMTFAHIQYRTRDPSLSRQNRTAVVFTTYKFEVCTMNHHRSAERFQFRLNCVFDRTKSTSCFKTAVCDSQKSNLIEGSRVSCYSRLKLPVPIKFSSSSRSIVKWFNDKTSKMIWASFESMKNWK